MSAQSRKQAKARVVVADNNREMRDKVVQLLRPAFDVVGTASDGASACEVVMLLEPEIVVLDISMPVKNGIEAAEEMKRKGSKTKTVFLTVHSDPDFVRAALRVGASAFVVKSQMMTDLVAAMTATAKGKMFISPSCAFTK